MATYEDHMTQAKHNEEIASFLGIPDVYSASWVITISFYAALQYLEAAFCNTGIGHSESYPNPKKLSLHKFRQELIEREPRTRDIFTDYTELRRASEIFRYCKPNLHYINDKQAANFLKVNLKNIKDTLARNKLITVEETKSENNKGATA